MFGRNNLPNASKKGVKKQALKAFLYLALFLVLMNIISFLITYASSRYECHIQWVESNMEYKYTVRGGCLLNLENGWVPATNYRVD